MKETFEIIYNRLIKAESEEEAWELAEGEIPKDCNLVEVNYFDEE